MARVAANYPRKPEGGPEREAVRFRFCCAAEGCGKRRTSGSLRFLGRRVYLGAIVVVATEARSVVVASCSTRRVALVLGDLDDASGLEVIERPRDETHAHREELLAPQFLRRLVGRDVAPVLRGDGAGVDRVAEPEDGAAGGV